MKKVLILLLCLFVGNSFASGISGGTTAPCDNATLNKYTGTANVEINWEPNTIGLKWFNGDQQIAGQTSCTYDGTITVPPQPTKPGYTFNGWKVQKITPPDGYTELEYIEGGQNLNAYINLGVPATPTMQTLLRASISEASTITNGGQQVIFGASNEPAYAGGKAYSVDWRSHWILLPNGNYDGSTERIDITTSLNTIYQFKINYPTVGTIGVDDVTKTAFTNITSVSSQNLYLFGLNGAGTYIPEFSTVKMKLYSLKLWDNGELIHNYIPARRNSDNTLGIYDTVTGAFLTNAGSGAFVAGPVVQ